MRLEYVRQELLELSEEQKHCEVQMARIAKERIALQARLTEKEKPGENEAGTGYSTGRECR